MLLKVRIRKWNILAIVLHTAALCVMPVVCRLVGSVLIIALQENTTKLTTVLKSSKVGRFTMIPCIIFSGEDSGADRALETRVRLSDVLIQILRSFNLI